MAKEIGKEVFGKLVLLTASPKHKAYIFSWGLVSFYKVNKKIK